MLNVNEIVSLHRRTTVDWHHAPASNEQTGFLRLICDQHLYNYMLWHEEDIARSPQASDVQIAAVKRSIDVYNQRRNDAIEQIDHEIAKYLELLPHDVNSVPMNSETPGSIIDRLSILSLREYHLDEQSKRDEISSDLRSSIQHKIDIVRQQHIDLSGCLELLWQDLTTGRKRHKVYRQLKMYNDPNLNPFLYRQED